MSEQQLILYGISRGFANYEHNQRIVDKVFKKEGISLTIPDPREFVNFSDTVWDEIIDFKGFFIPSNATFNNIIFNRRILFCDCMFMGDFELSGECNDLTHFNNSIFQNCIISTKFKNGVFFENTSFRGMANFGNSEFHSTAYFVSSNFLKSANFSKTYFSSLPIFIGSQINGDLSLNHRQLKGLQIEKGVNCIIDAWAKLKLEMSRMHLHEEELSFFAKELESRNTNSKTHLQRSLIKSYKAFSDYGRSIATPTLLLLWLIVVSMALYQVLIFGNGAHSLKAFSMSLQSALPFVPMDKGLSAKIDAYADLSGFKLMAIQTLRGTQTILSTVLLFLIGLGIRNRLRIK